MKNKTKEKKRAKTRENLYKKKKKNPSIEKQLIKFALIGKKIYNQMVTRNPST